MEIKLFVLDWKPHFECEHEHEEFDRACDECWDGRDRAADLARHIAGLDGMRYDRLIQWKV